MQTWLLFMLAIASALDIIYYVGLCKFSDSQQQPYVLPPGKKASAKATQTATSGHMPTDGHIDSKTAT